MKRLFTCMILISSSMFSQEHFAGLTTSSRVGLLTTTINPAELVNMSSRFEASLFGVSAGISNNKIGFNDLFSDADLESLIFKGNEPVNLRIDAEVYGPSFAIKVEKWAFGIATKAHGKLDVVDVDTSLGDALTNSGLNSLIGTTIINNDNNQRLSGTTWGEIDLTAARTVFENEKHQLNAGVTFKLLFPGSYSNLGLSKFNGEINNTLGDINLSNVNDVTLNIAYSGSLADSFSNFNDYAKSVFGSLNGFSGDIGLNYQMKDNSIIKIKKNNYLLNTGISIKNIGSMTFKDDNNNSTNYVLDIESTESLNLNQFENVDNLQEIENILLNSTYLTKVTDKKDFKVKLPTTISLYADVKLIPSLYISGFLQQKMNDNNDNEQITTQNILTITPRFYAGIFEIFAPFSQTEIAGFNSGIGFRVGGFYLGSGSIVTALINDSKQGDIYTGFRYGFL